MKDFGLAPRQGMSREKDAIESFVDKRVTNECVTDKWKGFPNVIESKIVQKALEAVRKQQEEEERSQSGNKEEEAKQRRKVGREDTIQRNNEKLEAKGKGKR
jgi:uncharacterized protein YktA (UPF0223 family)